MSVTLFNVVVTSFVTVLFVWPIVLCGFQSLGPFWVQSALNAYYASNAHLLDGYFLQLATIVDHTWVTIDGSQFLNSTISVNGIPYSALSQSGDLIARYPAGSTHQVFLYTGIYAGDAFTYAGPRPAFVLEAYNNPRPYVDNMLLAISVVGLIGWIVWALIITMIWGTEKKAQYSVLPDTPAPKCPVVPGEL